jgi:hypothetical protein
MRLVERECDELDWSNSGGRAVGGEGSIAIIPDHEEVSGSSGQRLGGGSTAISRLLRDTPAQAPPSNYDHSSHPTVPTSDLEQLKTPPPTVAPVPNSPVRALNATPEPMEVDDPREDVSGNGNGDVSKDTSPTLPEPPSQQSPPAPLFDASFSDYEPSTSLVISWAGYESL